MEGGGGGERKRKRQQNLEGLLYFVFIDSYKLRTTRGKKINNNDKLISK